MKKLLFNTILLGGILLLASPVLCQTKIPSPKQGGEINQPDYIKLKDYLSLTDVQADSWKKMDQKYETRIKGLNETTALTADQKKVKMQEIQNAKDAELKKILSVEQYNKLLEHYNQKKSDG